jgi:hypothetical protein
MRVRAVWRAARHLARRRFARHGAGQQRKRCRQQGQQDHQGWDATHDLEANTDMFGCAIALLSGTFAFDENPR